MEISKKKSILQKMNVLAKYFLYFVLLLVLSNVKIAGMQMAFAPAFLFALMWCDQKPYILAPIYIVTAIINSMTLANIISAVTCVFVLVFVYYIHVIIKKSMNVGLIFIYFVLSQVAYFYQQYVGAFLSVEPYIVGISAILFLFCCINFLQVIFSRGIFYRFTLDESICLFAFITAIGCGLANVDIVYLSAYKIFAIVGALILLCLNKPYLAVIFSLAVGLGVSLYTQSLQPIGSLIVLTLSASIFRYPYRYFMALAVLIADLVLAVIFGMDYLTIINSAIASIIVLAIPKEMLERLTDKWQTAMSEVATRNIVATTRKSIRRRMQNLSSVFFDMERLYKSLVKGSLTRDQVRDMLYNELIKTTCGDCLDKPKCLRSGMQQDLEHLIEVGLDKGRVTILDMPATLSARCGRSNAVVTKINQILNQYSSYNSMNASVDNAKILLSQTLGGVSKLLLNLGDEIDKNINFDSQSEAKIQDRLLAKNIICSEIMLYEQANNHYSATLIIKGEDAYSPELQNIVSDVCGCNMRIVEVTPSEKSGWQVVSMERMNKYDISFGLANCKKSGSIASGDCHSLLRLGANKFLLAVCDGMGSGERAEAQSAMTIGLIENFYRAGFDNEVVLSSVNKLLSVNSQEIYSTLDICLLDLDLGSADIIKVGSPFGAVKRADRIDIVEGGALPIGVLEQVSPKFYRTTISTTDFIILMTDGVTDAYESLDDFTDFLATIESINPQEIAETILADAIKRNESLAKDDMTVLVARTYQKS